MVSGDPSIKLINQFCICDSFYNRFDVLLYMMCYTTVIWHHQGCYQYLYTKYITVECILVVVYPHDPC